LCALAAGVNEIDNIGIQGVYGLTGGERGRVKIATAAEPEGGEGERGEFDEVLAQADEGAILKLAEAASFARHEK